MTTTIRLIPALLLPVLMAGAVQAQSIGERYGADARRIIAAATGDSTAWNRLAELTDTFGPRLSGSDNLERAIDWMIERMRADGLDNVRGEPVMVPRWVRGAESAELVSPRRMDLPMLGLGGSIATPRGGIQAEVMVVSNRDELTRRAAEARGKIVLFDVPFTSYGATVQYRTNAAVWAAQAGAVAALIRSVASGSMNSPHTGAMRYDSTVRRIPAAALSVEHAAMLARMAARGQRVVVRLAMSARTLPDRESRNVVGELLGRERPEEIVVVGGHIDSWDVGQGAMDDAGGVVAAWEALRVLQRLGLRPRRTIRVVGWTNEENGLRGATAYRDMHRDQVDNHILALESDNGVFRPYGVGFSGSDAARDIIRQIARLLAPIGADSVGPAGGGADIGPITQLGVPGMSPLVDGERYFWYHHSHADTMDKLDPQHVARIVAVMAVMTYIVADMPERLPRAQAPPR